MSRRMLVLEQWNEFVRTTLRPDAPAIQKQEMRRAFYAGAHMILFRVMAELSDGDAPTPPDLETMMSVQMELREFLEQVKAGRA
jgi:hypothetical protein